MPHSGGDFHFFTDRLQGGQVAQAHQREVQHDDPLQEPRQDDDVQNQDSRKRLAGHGIAVAKHVLEPSSDEGHLIRGLGSYRRCPEGYLIPGQVISGEAEKDSQNE